LIKYFLAFSITLLTPLFGANLHFSEYKLGDNSGHTLLVLGGIHGNEPGAYFASSILTQYYKIKNGNLRVIPNVNFDSIIANRRGIYGDMNRKFATIDKNDKDYKIVTDLKEIILQDDINMILNLHDGHGFYRKEWINTIFNPRAWGQACIIDQNSIDGVKFGNLDEITQQISKNLNLSLEKEHHLFSVKNTETKFKDEQMQLSLTYFAIRHSKPAVAIETSKNIKSLSQKVKYHLLAIEEFMKIMDIEYSRDFELTIDNIDSLLYPKEPIIINDSFIIEPNRVKSSIRYLPMTKDGVTKIDSLHPLVAIKEYKNRFDLMCGNRVISRLYPDYVKNISPIKSLDIEIDGVKKAITIPSKFYFKKEFKILEKKGYRVNVIGYSKRGVKNEVNIDISQKNLLSRFSMDRDKKCYRVEIYKDKNFAGMVLGCKK
jgi:hypothetical protein